LGGNPACMTPKFNDHNQIHAQSQLLHQRKTAVIRCWAFRAAAGFEFQIGERHASTSALSIRSTRLSRSGAA